MAANILTGAVWVLQTTGIVTRSPVFIKEAQITFLPDTTGLVRFDEIGSASDPSVAGRTMILYVQRISVYGNRNEFTQNFPIYNWVSGLAIKTFNNIAKCLLYIK